MKKTIRACLSSIANLVRKGLEEPPKPIAFSWQTIKSGPAAGCQVQLPIGSSLTQSIVAGTYESTNIRVLEAVLMAEDVCCDIGGHYGYYSLCMAKIANRGRVLTFEPVPAHADRIRKAAERSGLSHVSVCQMAVAGQHGSMTLKLAQESGGDDSMAFLESYGGATTEAAIQNYPKFTSITVATTTLDSLEMPFPRFIKIDAEGAEAAILQAGTRKIAEAQPRLLIELHSIHAALKCASILSSLDYRAVLLDSHGSTLPVLWLPNSDSKMIARLEEFEGQPFESVFANSDLGTNDIPIRSRQA